MQCVLCSKPTTEKDRYVHPKDGAVLHNSCAELYTPSTEPKADAVQAVDTVEDAGGELKCQQCGSGMKKTSRAERNMGLQLLGVLLFFVGVALCFVVPPFGLVMGIIVMIVAARLGYKKSKVWICKNCGYFFERAR